MLILDAITCAPTWLTGEAGQVGSWNTMLGMTITDVI
jgi:hypothetical protein